MRNLKPLTVLSCTAVLLGGCILPERLSNVGDPPEMSQIQDPTLLSEYEPVSMPMPRSQGQVRKVNSLWESGSRAFFKDQRANKVGDIVTIEIKRVNKFKVDAKRDTNHNNAYNAASPSLMGFEKKNRIFSRVTDPTNLFNITSSSAMTGNGKNDHVDDIDLKLAGTIIQVLPNGNMVVEGHQEIRHTNEVREIHLRGIIRREDISSGNLIPLEKIAEARISYGGRGDITDTQTLPWGVQALKKVNPF